MTGKRVLMVLAIFVICTPFLIACAVPGPNALEGQANEKGKVAGFWKGVWHGLMSPLTLFISLFSDYVNPYEVHNNGSWYHVGFALGVFLMFTVSILVLKGIS